MQAATAATPVLVLKKKTAEQVNARRDQHLADQQRKRKLTRSCRRPSCISRKPPRPWTRAATADDEGLETTVDTESVRQGGGVDDQFEISVKTRHKRTISETSD